MSAYQTAARYDEHPVGPPRRATTLTAAVAASVGAAVLNVVAAIVMLASTADIARNQMGADLLRVSILKGAYRVGMTAPA